MPNGAYKATGSSKGSSLSGTDSWVNPCPGQAKAEMGQGIAEIPMEALGILVRPCHPS